MTDPGSPVQVVVSLGTDHHKFDRLVDWIDIWLERSDSPPSCLVQYGASRPPRHAEGIARMPRKELLELYAQAAVVIVQGGPGSILDAREVGQLPIAVPRKPELHEVVDGHQLAFSEVMARHGNAILVSTREDMVAAIDNAMLHPESVHTQPRVSDAAAAAQKLRDSLDRLDHMSRAPITLRRVGQLLSQQFTSGRTPTNSVN